MVENMKCIASSDQELTVKERNLLFITYKNVIGVQRVSWQIVLSIEQKEESKGNEAQVSMIKGYCEKIELELSKICKDILVRPALSLLHPPQLSSLDSVNSVLWAPHKLGAILACASSDGKISILSFKGAVGSPLLTPPPKKKPNRTHLDDGQWGTNVFEAHTIRCNAVSWPTGTSHMSWLAAGAQCRWPPPIACETLRQHRVRQYRQNLGVLANWPVDQGRAQPICEQSPQCWHNAGKVPRRRVACLMEPRAHAAFKSLAAGLYLVLPYSSLHMAELLTATVF
jgi:hypothetical protein